MGGRGPREIERYLAKHAALPSISRRGAASYTPTMATVARTPDAELLTRLRARDRTAWEELYVEYQPRLRGFAYRLAGNEHDADDLVQETFVRAVPRTGQARSGDRRHRRLPVRDRAEPLPEAGRAGAPPAARRRGSRAGAADADRGRPGAQHAPRPAAGRGAAGERKAPTAPAAGARAAGARGPLLRGDRRARRDEGERGRAAHIPRARKPANRAPAPPGRPGAAPRGVPALPAAPRGPPGRPAEGREARRDARTPRRLRALPGVARGHARGVAPVPDDRPAARRRGGEGGDRRAADERGVLGRRRRGLLRRARRRGSARSSPRASFCGIGGTVLRRRAHGGRSGGRRCRFDRRPRRGPRPRTTATTPAPTRTRERDDHDSPGADDEPRRARPRPPSRRSSRRRPWSPK